MPRITLKYPELPELAGRVHDDLPGMLESIPQPDSAMVFDAEALCDTWVDPKFLELLNSLQLEKRIPNLESNVDSSDNSRRIVEFVVPDGSSLEDIREIIRAAWAATLNTYAEAFYLRVKEILTGTSKPDWTPDYAVDPPRI